ncbi:MAG TPA: FMN-binding protein [Thermomicrobiaceae bacterium]|nr:FMN-binding protein [Thermomicrobiaceae bacterium]
MQAKKLTVAALIIGAFVLFSFLHSHSSGALLPSGGKLASTTSQQQPTAPVTTSGPAPSPTPTLAPTPAPSSSTASSGASATSSGASSAYTDGTYTGSVADAQWGYVQVRATVQKGKITDVEFLQYPDDRSRSIFINQTADPELSSEAIQAQSAQVDIITGATDSSQAFIQSLSDALSQAQTHAQTQSQGSTNG